MLKSLLDAGATVVFGTDFPVEPIRPMEGLLGRRTPEPQEPGTPSGGARSPSSASTREQAIRLYTATPAFRRSGRRARRARLRRMLADLVVWDRDLLSRYPTPRS